MEAVNLLSSNKYTEKQIVCIEEEKKQSKFHSFSFRVIYLFLLL
jgi:hypothetical protein